MFKSIQKSGRIAAVAIGLIAALSPLAAPPAALAGGSVPTPELEKSYSFKTSSEYSYTVTNGNTKFGYLYDYDDDYNLISVSLINFKDGSTSPVAIPDKSLNSACLAPNDLLCWEDGNNLIVFSPDKQTQTVHPINSAKYAHTDVTVSDDGKRAAVEHYDYEYEPKKVEIYDLKTDKLIQTYQSNKDDSSYYYSKDMSRLYAIQDNTKDGVVALRVFNCDTGSTELKTVNVKKDGRSSEIDYVRSSLNSDDIYLQSETALIKADRDGNMRVLLNDDDHAPDWLYSYPSTEFYALYTKKGSNDLFEEDDGYYDLKEEDANLSIYDLKSDKIISSIAYPFGDGYLSDVSHDGSILLGISLDDDKSSACLVDAQTGAKRELDSRSFGLVGFMDGDRKILAQDYDKDDLTTLHVNIYKSNIPHSVPEDVLYFIQTHLPFVIGGGVAIVLIIGGAIVVLCIRKKRAKAANGATAAMPKPQRKQRRRQKRAQQNVATSTAPATPVAPAAPTEPARFCRHCGTPLVPEAQFCPTCGQKVD